MKRVVVVLVAAVLVVVSALPDKNMTTPEVNPGCGNGTSCEEPWIVATASVGSTNTLQHLWGAREALSFLVVAGVGTPGVNVKWEDLRRHSPDSITFSQCPSHVFGFVIPSLILYNDTKDSGAFDEEQDSLLRVPVANFTWVAHVLEDHPLEAAVMLETTHYQGVVLPNSTRLRVQVAAYGHDGRSNTLPHLLFTPDSAQVDLILDHLNLNLTQEYSRARWGLEIVLFSSEGEAGEEEEEAIQFGSQRSLDDEHTPGVFHLDEITTAGARAGVGGGYLQWRPVSYLSPVRDIARATNPNLNTTLSPLVGLSPHLKASLAYAVLGKNLTKPGNAVTTVLSFGRSKDGFYRASNYTTWTVALGEGEPPRETFSTLVLVVICLGIALPAAMLLVGCVVLAARRCNKTPPSEPLLEA